MDEETNFPIGASRLRRNLYMDDVLCGAATLKETIVLRQQLKGILKSAGMELHKLCANHEKLSPDPEQNYNFATLTETKTLEVSWKPNLDCFLIKVKVCLDNSYTKRDDLSTIAKIFDPVGLMAPVISKAKIFLQQIPRRKAFPEVIEIHGFADISEQCYGAAVYCKSKNLKSETLVRLTTSKSRVASIKSLTILRLELCSEVLLAKLVKRVLAALQLETAELYLWIVKNLKDINRVAGPLTTKEFEKAETFLVKKVQEQEFSSDMSHLKSKESVPPNSRNVELCYSEDKKARVVKIKNQYSTCERDISKICVLPMEVGGLWETGFYEIRRPISKVVKSLKSGSWKF
ncbi:uncharacterized protein TNCV_4966121 [Trichonephila clavipes]|nr:uncharacterized protein TNCV_4966121 [Trichonephila clavipes]